MANNILEKVYYIHDIECNQKYSGTLPYSFHLKSVVNQCEKYSNLLKVNYTASPEAILFDLLDKREVIKLAAGGHDLIEDARMTLNDVKNLLGVKAAEIVYCCTEEKGKNREERHSDKFFSELKLNRDAVFVKLCDICANVLFSILTNSSMYNKYQKEFPKLYSELYIKGEYDIIWNDLKSYLKWPQ